MYDIFQTCSGVRKIVCTFNMLFVNRHVLLSCSQNKYWRYFKRILQALKLHSDLFFFIINMWNFCRSWLSEWEILIYLYKAECHGHCLYVCFCLNDHVSLEKWKKKQWGNNAKIQFVFSLLWNVNSKYWFIMSQFQKLQYFERIGSE